jgi:hypothetical protein
MGKRSEIWISFCLVAAFSGAAKGQAVTEYGGMSRHSVTTTTRTIGPSKQINGIWSGLDKTLKGVPNDAGSPATQPGATVQRPPARARKTARARGVTAVYESPARVQPGMSYREVVRRFGPPAYQVATGPGTMALAYLRKDGNVDIELQDARVIKVAGARRQQIAAVSPK